jgi:hypothetical protein
MQRGDKRAVCLFLGFMVGACSGANEVPPLDHKSGTGGRAGASGRGPGALAGASGTAGAAASPTGGAVPGSGGALLAAGGMAPLAGPPGRGGASPATGGVTPGTGGAASLIGGAAQTRGGTSSGGGATGGNGTGATSTGGTGTGGKATGGTGTGGGRATGGTSTGGTSTGGTATGGTTAAGGSSSTSMCPTTTTGTCPSSLTCPTGANGTIDCGCYLVPGLGATKKILLDLGASAMPFFLASAMIETDTMLTSSYPPGDGKTGDSSCWGLAKQNWGMISSCYPDYQNLGSSDYMTGADLNGDTATSRALDIQVYITCRNFYGDTWFDNHRGTRNAADIQNFTAGQEWTNTQLQNGHLCDDVRFWVNLPAV